MRLAEAYQQYLPLIESEMQAVLSSPADAVNPHYGMMQYHMGWLDENLSPISAPTGKRIRPMLCVLACGAAGGRPESRLAGGRGTRAVAQFLIDPR